VSGYPRLNKKRCSTSPSRGKWSAEREPIPAAENEGPEARRGVEEKGNGKTERGTPRQVRVSPSKKWHVRVVWKTTIRHHLGGDALTSGGSVHSDPQLSRGPPFPGKSVTPQNRLLWKIGWGRVANAAFTIAIESVFPGSRVEKTETHRGRVESEKELSGDWFTGLRGLGSWGGKVRAGAGTNRDIRRTMEK